MIAVIAAMDKEVEAILRVMDTYQRVEYSHVPMAEGTLCGQRIIVMKSGVGKVNAALSTTVLLERLQVSGVINIGTAGGLKEDENILDAVISTRVVQHDFDTSPVDGEEGIGLYFEADQDLADVCVQALEQLDVHVHRGLIATGDQFIANDAEVQKLTKRFPEAICAEMEAGAVAQVCAHYNIPFVCMRSLSDVAVRKDSHMDFIEYVEAASARSAEFCKALVNILA